MKSTTCSCNVRQVWKQKGEEYRVTGGQGWIWIRSTYNASHTPQDTVGLRAAAIKLQNRKAKMTNGESNSGMDFTRRGSSP